MGLMCLLKEEETLGLSHHHGRGQEEGPHLNLILLAAWPGFPVSRTVKNKLLLFKPHSLWCFVMAAWAKAKSFIYRDRYSKTANSQWYMDFCEQQKSLRENKFFIYATYVCMTKVPKAGRQAGSAWWVSNKAHISGDLILSTLLYLTHKSKFIRHWWSS